MRNVVQGLIDALRNGQRSQISARLSEIEQLIDNEDWDRAVARAKEAAQVAQHAGHLGMLSSVGRLLEQLGEFEVAAPIRFAGERRSYRPRGRLWKGERIADRTLVIDQVFDRLGQQFRHARLIAPAVGCSRRCIVLTESRLIPILQRTFSEATVLDLATEYAAAHASADFVTNAWDLAQQLGDTPAKLVAGFVPLKPDPDAVVRFQTEYAARAHAPFVGISWATKNAARQTPELADWAELLSETNATFVSLQYGTTDAAVETLGRFCSRPILNDRSVDQLVNLDRFAAQIASLDMIVSIDNTVAHAASAIGKRVIVLTDDGPSHWPLRGDRTPWYPFARIVRRRGRTWKEVLAEARQHMEAEPARPGSRDLTEIRT